MAPKIILIWVMLVFIVFATCEAAWVKLSVQSQRAVEIELIGYNGITETSIFTGNVVPGTGQMISTQYQGLALLVFTSGQRYPVIIGKESFTLHIAAPGEPPSFSGSGENDFFYKSLAGGVSAPGQYDFVHLMIQAKELLESSYSIHALEELTAKKKEFQEFVATHYDKLKHSDMLRRLIAQYFMMHEYVNYHQEGAPAEDIQVQYQKEVLNGVMSWLNVLRIHIPVQETLNYIVSLYYSRSMITLASIIIENFKDVAFCPGAKKKIFHFSDDIHIRDVDGNQERTLGDFAGKKIIAFASDDCPVSMVVAIAKAREMADQKENVSVIVAPLQKLSRNHLAMSKMIRKQNMLFIDDDNWRKENLTTKIKLPLFVNIGDSFD